jgi:hypothetical protein
MSSRSFPPSRLANKLQEYKTLGLPCNLRLARLLDVGKRRRGTFQPGDCECPHSTVHPPLDRGTILRLALRYMPPAGSIGAAIAKLFGKDPEAEIAADLRRLKQLLETGEISATKGQPVGGFRTRRECQRAQERNRDLLRSSSEAIPSETAERNRELQHRPVGGDQPPRES